MEARACEDVAFVTRRVFCNAIMSFPRGLRCFVPFRPDRDSLPRDARSPSGKASAIGRPSITTHRLRTTPPPPSCPHHHSLTMRPTSLLSVSRSLPLLQQQAASSSSSGAASSPFTTAHRSYVKSLYKRYLKNELDWVIRRDIWRDRAIEIRAEVSSQARTRQHVRR